MREGDREGGKGRREGEKREGEGRRVMYFKVYTTI